MCGGVAIIYFCRFGAAAWLTTCCVVLYIYHSCEQVVGIVNDSWDYGEGIETSYSDSFLHLHIAYVGLNGYLFSAHSYLGRDLAISVLTSMLQICTR